MLRFAYVRSRRFNGGPAYSPDTNLLYMNGIDWCAQAIKGPTPEYVEGKPYLGWANGYGNRDSIEQAFGLVNAIDAASGRLVWRYGISSPAVAGLTATAGGLVMTGDVNGEFIALDAATGAPLYQSNLGLGAIDSGVVTYEVNGKQFIAVATGDNNAGYKAGGDNTIVVFAPP